MWILRTLGAETEETQQFRLLPGYIKTIGRAPGADFVIDASLVSRVHCRLTVFADGAVEVEDLESTNGTWLNGERINRAPLVEGAILKVGRVELVLERSSPGT